MGGIVWLASYPKSGNTWMRAFLHNLLTNAKEPVAPDDLDKFTYANKASGWYTMHLGNKPFAECTEEEFSQVRHLVHRDFTRAFPDSVFVKTHSYLGEDDFNRPMITMECTAGAIYIVRNPLDVVLSTTGHYGVSVDQAIERMNWIRNALGADGKSVSEPLSTWSLHVKSWTSAPNDRLHVVRYEDMLAKPGPTFRGVCRFLRLDPPVDRFTRAIKFSSFDTLRKLEEKKGFKERSETAERFFRVGTAEQWRTKLSPDQVRRIVADHREQMARFGYVPEGY